MMIEVPVNGGGGPFLVSGIRQEWVWISNAKTGILRAAVRPGPVPDDIFVRIVTEIAARGTKNLWENCYPYTDVGLSGAVEYVTSFGIKQVEALVPKDSTLSVPGGVTLSESEWIPQGRAVVIPLDRTYLGMIGVLGAEYHMVVIHNPSRGMAVLGIW
jgi:hypothetical protein